MTFLPTLPSSNEHSGRESNPITQPVYMYLSGSAFLASEHLQISNILK